MGVFSSGCSNKRRATEGFVNQFFFSVVLRTHKGVSMTTSVATKIVHDASMKAFHDFDIPFADVSRDTENYSELEHQAKGLAREPLSISNS